MIRRSRSQPQRVVKPTSTPLPPPRASRRRRGTDLTEGTVQTATVAGAALFITGLVLMMTREFADVVVLLGLVPAGVAALLWMVRRFAEPEDLRLVQRAVAAGILLRLGLALVNHYLLPVWFFAPDQVTYDSVGWRTLLYHRGLGSMPWQIQNTAEVGYFYWNAFLFLIFGNAPVAPRIWNGFVGVASAVVAYRIAGELAGKQAARYALLLTMFFPSLILWSSLNLRDPVVLLVTLAMFFGVVRLRKKPTALSLFAVILSLGLLVTFRDYMAVMAVFGLVGSSVIGRGRGLPTNLLIGAVLFGLAVLAYRQFGLGSEWVEAASFEAMAQQRVNMATGGSAFAVDADVSTPLRGLQFLPLGMTLFLFAPFPWQVGSTLSLMTLPEQIVWYALLPSVILGGVHLVRTRLQVFGPILVFLAITTSVYALVEGNVGTAYRHRAQVLVFFLIIAAVGLAVRGARKEAAQKPRGPL